MIKAFLDRQEQLPLHPRINGYAGEGYSLDAQKDKLRKYTEYQDMTIVSKFSEM